MFMDSQNPDRAWRWGNPYRDYSAMATNRPCWKCGQYVPHHYHNGRLARRTGWGFLMGVFRFGPNAGKKAYKPEQVYRQVAPDEHLVQKNGHYEVCRGSLVPGRTGV
jgi:hypothetical protein